MKLCQRMIITNTSFDPFDAALPEEYVVIKVDRLMDDELQKQAWSAGIHREQTEYFPQFIFLRDLRASA